MEMRERSNPLQSRPHSARCSLEDSVDEDVERKQLSIFQPGYVDAFGDGGAAERSILPGNASNAKVFLNRGSNFKGGTRKLALQSRDNGADLFGSLMDAIGSMKIPSSSQRSAMAPFLLSRSVSLKTLYRFCGSR